MAWRSTAVVFSQQHRCRRHPPTQTAWLNAAANRPAAMAGKTRARPRPGIVTAPVRSAAVRLDQDVDNRKAPNQCHNAGGIVTFDKTVVPPFPEGHPGTPGP